MKIIYKIFFAAFIGIIFGCSSETNPENEPQIDDVHSSLSDVDKLFSRDRRWLLAAYTSASGEVTRAATDVPYTFFFSSSDQESIDGFGGFDDCNVYGTNGLVVQDNLISVINGINADAAFCDQQLFGVNANQGQFFFSVISDSFTYQFVNAKLVLESQFGSLTFNACTAVDPDYLDSECADDSAGNTSATTLDENPISELNWTLESVRSMYGKWTQLPLNPGWELHFGNDGAVSGRDQCNPAAGQWTEIDGVLRIANWASPNSEECDELRWQLDEAVQLVQRALGGEAMIPTVEGRRLILETGAGELLVFSGTDSNTTAIPVDTTLLFKGSLTAHNLPSDALLNLPALRVAVFHDRDALLTAHADAIGVFDVAPSLPEVDFNKYTVVGVWQGYDGNLSTYASTRGAYVTDEGLTFHLVTTSPTHSGPPADWPYVSNCAASTAITAPYYFFAIESVHHPVLIDEMRLSYCEAWPSFPSTP